MLWNNKWGRKKIKLSNAKKTLVQHLNFFNIKAATESSSRTSITRLRYILNNSHKIFVINPLKA
jgi:hypothetical protein